MGIGHKAACKIAHEAKLYAVVLTPDRMVSDGTVGKPQEHAENGVELVWVAALRFGEEPFWDISKRKTLFRATSRLESGKPLVITGRQMVFAAVTRHALRNTELSGEWEASYFVEIPSSAVCGECPARMEFWSIPSVGHLCCFDFGAVKSHDTSALEQWTIDGDYIFKNLELHPRSTSCKIQTRCSSAVGGHCRIVPSISNRVSRRRAQPSTTS